MILGLIMVQVLEGENVIVCYCELMGKINLEEVVCGILCVDYVLSMCYNLVYGSDSFVLVVCEIEFFFLELEICFCLQFLRQINQVFSVEFKFCIKYNLF